MSNGNFPEWLNVNAGRAYPLAENSSRLDLTGTISLPNSLIVAAQINMVQRYALGTFWISQVIATPTLVSITVSFQDTAGGPRAIATIPITVWLHTENKTYSFTGQGVDASILGSLTIGNLNDTLAAIPGTATFGRAATPFEVSALFVSAPALEAIQVYNGQTLLATFNNILKFRAGENIRLSYVNGSPNTIRIDAISGLNLTTPGTCQNQNTLAVPAPIRTINGVAADQNGNFQLAGGNCIGITTATGALTLTDLCAQSCCGCNELQALMTGLQAVEAQILQYQQQALTVIGQQSSMIANLSANLQ